MAAPKAGSRDLIMDTAEALFAERGFEAAFTRDIAAAAGVTLGTFSYHFSSKNSLLAEVVGRRFEELMDARRVVYAQVVAKGGVPSLEDTVASIVRPFLEKALCGGPRWASYCSLLGRMMYVGDLTQFRFIEELTNPVGRELLSWISAAAPSASMADVGYSYQFMLGAMIDAASQNEHDRLRTITDGACSIFDHKEVIDRLVVFVVGGMMALLNR